MTFKRTWDSCCPHTWVSWEDKEGVKWVIRDLRPEDDDTAVNILLEHLCKDELLCGLSGLLKDPVSVRCAREVWKKCLAERTSLGCYVERDGDSQLVALNVCMVASKDDEALPESEGKAWQSVLDVMAMCEKSVDCFKHLDVDQHLHGLGLIVPKQYRGRGLGAKLLAAREPLCLHHGVKGTATVFTGPAAQISAERVGFTTVNSFTLKDLAESGLNYPKDDSKVIKLMVKKY